MKKALIIFSILYLGCIGYLFFSLFLAQHNDKRIAEYKKKEKQAFLQGFEAGRMVEAECPYWLEVPDAIEKLDRMRQIAWIIYDSIETPTIGTKYLIGKACKKIYFE